jgi:arylsulfatase
MTEQADRRSIVFVTIDSLRADYCGFSGHDRELTPTLDSFAEDGTVFENAVAPGPSTSESVPAIVTGDYPVEREEVAEDIDQRISRIKPHLQARRTIAERLSEIGYETAAFTPNPFTSRYFGYDDGFDHFEDFLDGSRDQIYQRLLKGMKGSDYYLPVRILLNWTQREEAFKPWEAFYDDIIEWADNQNDPYFIWVFLMDVHHPYLSDRETRSQSILKEYFANWELRRKQYDLDPESRTHDWLVQSYEDSIRYMDKCLDQLATDLDDDNPVFVVTGDHGEAFGEHDSYEHHGGAFGQEGEQEYHSFLYDENIHVPLVLGNYDGVDSIEDPVSLSAIPDILESVATGQDITEVADDFAFSKTMDDDKIAVRGRRYKSITKLESIKVYDLDRGETEHIENGELSNAFGSFVAGVRNTTEEQGRLSSWSRQFSTKSERQG